jgi:hypothetical protein
MTTTSSMMVKPVIVLIFPPCFGCETSDYAW